MSIPMMSVVMAVDSTMSSALSLITVLCEVTPFFFSHQSSLLFLKLQGGGRGGRAQTLETHEERTRADGGLEGAFIERLAVPNGKVRDEKVRRGQVQCHEREQVEHALLSSPTRNKQIVSATEQNNKQ